MEGKNTSGVFCGLSANICFEGALRGAKTEFIIIIIAINTPEDIKTIVHVNIL